MKQSEIHRNKNEEKESSFVCVKSKWAAKIFRSQTLNARRGHTDIIDSERFSLAFTPDNNESKKEIE